MRVERLELSKPSNDEELVRRLESLRNFAQSIYRQLQAHTDYIRGGQFIVGVEEAASNVVVTKCLPEIWKLRANIDDLSRKFDKSKSLLKRNKNKRHSYPDLGVDALQNEVENILLRLAALGG